MLFGYLDCRNILTKKGPKNKTTKGCYKDSQLANTIRGEGLPLTIQDPPLMQVPNFLNQIIGEDKSLPIGEQLFQGSMKSSTCEKMQHALDIPSLPPEISVLSNSFQIKQEDLSQPDDLMGTLGTCDDFDELLAHFKDSGLDMMSDTSSIVV